MKGDSRLGPLSGLGVEIKESRRQTFVGRKGPGVSLCVSRHRGFPDTGRLEPE